MDFHLNLRHCVLHGIGVIQQLEGGTGTLLVADLQGGKLLGLVPLHKGCNKEKEQNPPVCGLVATTCQCEAGSGLH